MRGGNDRREPTITDPAVLQDHFRTIRHLVDAACDDALHQKGLFAGESINWGDLGFGDAEYCIDDQGHACFRVVIEEASPSARGLADFVDRYLETHGYDSDELPVYTVCQW